MSIQPLKLQHLLGTAWMVDTSVAGPPWPVLIFNTLTQNWEAIGKAGIKMQWRGQFVSDGSYYVGDVVRVGNAAYICTATPSPILDTRADTFVRADQAEWGTASDGHIWHNVAGPTAGLDSISSNRGLATTDSSGNVNSKVLGPAFAAPELDLSVRWSVTVSVAPNDGISLFLGINDSGVGSSVSVTLDGGIVIIVAGTAGSTNPTGWAGGTVGTAYRVRCQVQEDTVRVRVWADGTTEPGAWDVEWPSGISMVPGYVGLCNIAHNPSTAVAFDAFDAHMLRAAIPNPSSDSAHWELVAG